ncbi:MAG: A24 family peptidase [Pseudomonadota bacterium]
MLNGPLAPHDLAVAFGAMLFSPMMGSFLQAAADRLSTDDSVLGARSHCDHCGRTIAPGDLVPILSWLLLRGRSRCCGRPLGTRLIAAEIAVPLLTAWALLAVPAPLWPVTVALGWALAGLVLADLASFRLPDIGTLGLTIAGLGLALAGMTGAPLDHALGAAAGYALMRAIALGYRAWRGREGLGHGDAKLMAAAGAWLGWQALPSVLLVASLAGLVLALVLARATAGGRLHATLALPFGPPLALGFWCAWLYGPLVLG